MAYSADTFTSLEQPTLAKWNKLWDNDAFFNSQIGTGFGSGTTSKVWWEELGRTTLGSNGTTISVTGLSARKHLKVLVSVISTGGTIASTLRFNNDSSAIYAYQYSFNRAATGAATSGTAFSIQPASGAEAYGFYSEVTISNRSDQCKIIHADNVDAFGTDATTSVNFSEMWGKYFTNTQVTRVDCIMASGTGQFATGSQVIVLGHD